MSKILGVDIGGTFTRYGLVVNDDVLFSKKIKTDSITNFAQFIIDIYHHSTNIQLISIGIPGVVKQNEIVSVPNIKRLENFPLVDIITKELAVTVIINKDVNLLFLYDIYKERLSSKDNILGIYLGTGLGNALYIHGQLMLGDHGFSGELGHTPIIGNDQKCECGKIGCVETIVSGKKLYEIYENEKFAIDFKDLFKKHANHSKIIEYLDNFARIISTELNLMDISILLLGGGVINMKAFPKALLIKFIKSYLRTETQAAALDVRFMSDDPIGSIKGAALITQRGK
jgi:allose kinase